MTACVGMSGLIFERFTSHAFVSVMITDNRFFALAQFLPFLHKSNNYQSIAFYALALWTVIPGDDRSSLHLSPSEKGSNSISLM